MTDRILGTTKYLRLIDRDGWYFAQRCGGTGVVTIVALTAARALLLVEQVRPPLGRATLELPAGLAGDEVGRGEESLAEAARRELLEETGYEAGAMEFLVEAPTSPGLSDERVSFFLATDLRKASAGGGVGDERITVHEIPWSEVPTWLAERSRQGTPVAAKVYAGLYFAARRFGLP
jgi:ADP-ribose pyrophosphatase